MRSTPDTPTAPASARYMPARQDGAPLSAAATACPTLSSEQLLQGRKLIEISHNGSVYRLQATKLGKLILTK